MSEMIKEFKKGDLLYIDEDRKAYWGLPQGYPYKEGVSIEWDGNKEGLYNPDKTHLYLVSEEIIPNDVLKQGQMSSTNIEVTQLAPIWDELVEMGYVTDDYCDLLDILVIRKTNVNIPHLGITVNKPGVYFVRVAGEYTTKLNCETIHTMSPEFLPSATSATHGTVKQMSYIPNATGDAPTAENFNQLLRELKSAGLMRRS